MLAMMRSFGAPLNFVAPAFYRRLASVSTPEPRLDDRAPVQPPRENIGIDPKHSGSLLPAAAAASPATRELKAETKAFPMWLGEDSSTRGNTGLLRPVGWVVMGK